MKVWLVGANGMLGSDILALLKDEKIDFIATTKSQVDITSLESIDAFAKDKNFTHLINCAAYTKVDLAENEKEFAYLVNVKGVQNLAKVAKKQNIKFLHFSTDYVFDGNSDQPYIETDFCNPINYYGKTKLESEKILLHELCDCCIIRTSWLFGENGNNFILNMLNLMQKNKTLNVVNDQFGRPAYTKDLAKVSLMLLNEKGIFHYANSETTTWYELTKAIYDLAKTFGINLLCEEILPVTSDEFITFAKRPKTSVLSTKKLENLLQIKPRSWKNALEEFFKKISPTVLR